MLVSYHHHHENHNHDDATAGTLQQLAKHPMWPMSEVAICFVTKHNPNKPHGPSQSQGHHSHIHDHVTVILVGKSEIKFQ